MNDLLVTNGAVWTMDPANPRVEDGAIYIRDGKVVVVGPAAQLAEMYPDAAVLDAGGGIILPGFIIAHTHLYGAFARGIDVGEPAPRNFPEILRKLWWRLDRALTGDDVEASALLGMSECLHAGTTAIVDHHASPNAAAGSLDRIRDAADRLGLRTCLCYEVSDRDGSKAAESGIAENIRYASRCLDRPDDRHAAAFGMHASMTLLPGTLARCVEEARALGTPLHVHAAEDVADQEDSVAKYGLRVIERLARAHALDGPDLIGHGIHLDDRERALLAERGSWILHNPESNMNNAVGWSDVGAFAEAGVPVALGTDGMSGDLVAAIRAAGLIQRHATADPRTGWDAPGRYLAANAALAGQLWGRPMGVLKAGAAGDVCVRDYRPPTPRTPGNLGGHIVFGLAGATTRHTVVGGRVLLRDGCLQADVDEARLRARCRELAAALWKRW